MRKKAKMVECPNHDGAFDCTPFCSICEGEQEYESTGTLPCEHCGTAIDEGIYKEELGLCLECSNKYFTHEDEETE
jgi:hypothetical protein